MQGGEEPLQKLINSGKIINMLITNNLTVETKNESGTWIQILKKINIQIKAGEINLLLGPNGAGKSTLAKAILNFPGSKKSGEIIVDKQDITKYSTEKIVNQCKIFISHQNPSEISGINILEFTRSLYNRFHKEDIKSGFEFLDEFNELLEKVGLEKEFVDREVNVAYSGGEKKKAEIIQMLVMQPRYAILDEIDSGLDIESVKRIYKIINEAAKKNRTGFLIITHSPSIIKYLTPDNTYIMVNGEINKHGDIKLAKQIADKGYFHD